MGTRNLTVIIKDNKIRLSQYGQWDGYFSCAGEKFFNFVKNIRVEGFKKDVDYLRAVKDSTYDSLLDKFREVEEFLHKKKLNIPFSDLALAFSRDTGVKILDIIEDMHFKIHDGSNFPVYIGNTREDCKWVEFAYILDLDNETVYMLTNWEFEGEPESVPQIISKNYPLNCCYKCKLIDLPSVEEIKKILEKKRKDSFG